MARTTQTPGRRSKEFSVEFDQVQINRLFDDLERQIGTKFLKQIVRGETAAILFAAARKTAKASEQKIRASSGLDKYKDVNYIINARPEFKKILRKRQLRLAEKIRRIGLAKDAWLQIARKLKLEPMNANQKRGLTKLIKNRPTVNKRTINHRATGGREVSKGKGTYSIHIFYGNPVGRWTGASPALRSAIYGRRAYFKRNLKEAVFYRAKNIAAKYPGIELTRR